MPSTDERLNIQNPKHQSDLLWLTEKLQNMDGWMDILETGPGVGIDALLMQPVATQVQHSQMDAALQRPLCHLLNQILIHL